MIIFKTQTYECDNDGTGNGRYIDHDYEVPLIAIDRIKYKISVPGASKCFRNGLEFWVTLHGHDAAKFLAYKEFYKFTGWYTGINMIRKIASMT